MKELVKHLVNENIDEIVSKSILHCHAYGVNSIMLLDSPGKTIRLFVATEGHELWKNYPHLFAKEKMSVGFHPHHCNITLHVLQGSINNWIVAPKENGGLTTTKFHYQSAIKDNEAAFVMVGRETLATKTSAYLNKRDAVKMSASDIHTVACPMGRLAAWLVYEGKEDGNYSPVCWSNDALDTLDFSLLYKPMTEQMVLDNLKMAGLL